MDAADVAAVGLCANDELAGAGLEFVRGCALAGTAAAAAFGLWFKAG